MRIGILVIVLGLITACASNPSGSSADAKQAQNKDGIICTEVRPVGSYLKEKKCTTPEQREAERRQQETLMDVRNSRDSGIQ